MSTATKTTTPAVGMGATELMHSDRHAGTIIAIKRDRKGKVVEFTFQKDTAVRIDNNGQSDSQNYAYVPNTEGYLRKVTLRSNGHWVLEGDRMKGGRHFSIGERDEFYDFSF